MLSRDQILHRAQNGLRESRTLDFKSRFNPDSTQGWCEIIKDIVAFANSGGGVIVVGVNDEGSPTGLDVSPILEIDSADVTNKIAKYTGYQFSEFEFVLIERDGAHAVAIIVTSPDVLLVFEKPGVYQVDGIDKKAFSEGTIYFRHGSKSDTATRDDLVQWRDRELERIKTSWLGGIKQVIEAPFGHMVQMVSTESAQEARLTTSEDAPLVRVQNPMDVWPLRQSDLIEHINSGLPESFSVNGHDIFCIKEQFGIDENSHPDYMFRSHPRSSPQYSVAFADWILEQVNSDSSFFQNARQHHRGMM